MVAILTWTSTQGPAERDARWLFQPLFRAGGVSQIQNLLGRYPPCQHVLVHLHILSEQESNVWEAKEDLPVATKDASTASLSHREDQNCVLGKEIDIAGVH